MCSSILSSRPPAQRCQVILPACSLLLAICGVITLQSPQGLLAASTLLEEVKTNPSKAKALCRQFKAMNSAGNKATELSSVAQVAREQNLSAMDAEILITYVIGLHCPDVR